MGPARPQPCWNLNDEARVHRFARRPSRPRHFCHRPSDFCHGRTLPELLPMTDDAEPVVIGMNLAPIQETKPLSKPKALTDDEEEMARLMVMACRTRKRSSASSFLPIGH